MVRKFHVLLAVGLLALTAAATVCIVIGTRTAGQRPASGTAAGEPPQGEQVAVSDRSHQLLGEMSLEEKIYQLFFVTPEAITGVSTATQAGSATRSALEQYPVGGIIYFADNIQSPEQITKMIESSQSYSKLPLFIGVDEEGGTVSRIGSNPNMGATKFPSMKEIGRTGDPKKAEEVGATIAQEISVLGFNVDFAPVADVITNNGNTEIGSRSFGSDPDAVADMVSHEVAGLQDNGVNAVLKHFPAHGSTTGDSHKGAASSSRTLEEIRTSELVPFRAGIEAGVRFVMVSHTSMDEITGTATPSSLSKEIVTDLLRQELGFTGLVITDSLRMGAVAEAYPPSEAAVMALEAGVDMLLMPADLDAAFAGIADAVENGRLSEERIDQSVARILQVKLDCGLLE